MSRSVKVLAVVGARPQFVKAAALHRAWLATPSRKQIRLEWLHTGQHYDPLLSDIFFRRFQLPDPEYILSPGTASGLPQLVRILDGMQEPLKRSVPDAVLVFGDTNSTLAAGLAASMVGIPVAHVEAGIRSHNPDMPEERNRVLTDHLSAVRFCPSEGAMAQLRTEGLKRGNFLVGDIMIDVLLEATRKMRRRDEGYYVATIHRNINTDDPDRLIRIMEALNGLDRPVRFFMHPRTRACWDAVAPKRRTGLTASGTLRFLEPVFYGDLMKQMMSSSGVITDSGGVQKEAFVLGIPCVTLRQETEWPETVRSGRNQLCEPRAASIVRAFAKSVRACTGKVPGVYGQGDTGRQIISLLKREFSS